MALIETDFGSDSSSTVPNPEPAAPQGNPLALLLYAMGRSRVLIASAAILGILLGFVYGAVRLNVFQATGKMLLRVGVREGSTAETGVTQDSMTAGLGGREAMFTELELLSSPTLLARVVKKVGATRIIQFHDPLSFDDESTGSITKLLHQFQSWWFRDMKELDPAQFDIDEAALLSLEGGLMIEAAGFSSVIAVGFQGQDKYLCKEIVDAYMKAAEEYHREAFSTKAQLDLQEERLNDSRERIQTAEAALSAYQKEWKIFDLAYQMESLLKAVSDLQKTIDETLDLTEVLRHRKTYLNSIIKGDNPTRNLLLGKIRNPKIAVLERELVQWKRMALEGGAGLERNAHERDKRKKKIEDEIKSLEQRLKDTPEFLSEETDFERFLDDQLEIESGIITNEKLLEKQNERMKVMQARLEELQSAEARLSVMKEELRQAKAERDTAAAQVDSLGLIALLDDKKMGNLRILHEATMSRYKVAPKRSKFLIFGLVMGLGIGLMLALARVLTDGFVRRPADVSKLTNKPTLAVVRKGTRAINRDGSPKLISPHPHDSLDVVRDTIWHSLANTSMHGQKMRFAVVSDTADCNHGMISAAMAIGVARWNRKRTIIIETEFTRPTVATCLGADALLGLSNVLDGSCTIEEALQSTVIEHLWVLPAGSGKPPSAGWRASQQAQDLFSELYKQFHYVILDLAPLTNTPETHNFLQDTDTALIVTQAGLSKKQALKELSEVLAEARVPLGGTVIKSYKGFKLLWLWGPDKELLGVPG